MKDFPNLIFIFDKLYNSKLKIEDTINLDSYTNEQKEEIETKFNTWWNSHKDKIKESYKTYLDISLNENHIVPVYLVVGIRNSFAPPLTLKIYDNDNVLGIDYLALIHELIHYLCDIDPKVEERYSKMIKEIQKIYPNESGKFHNHIVTTLIEEKIFDEILIEGEPTHKALSEKGNPYRTRIYKDVYEAVDRDFKEYPFQSNTNVFDYLEETLPKIQNIY